VAIRFTRPSVAELRALAEISGSGSLTYAPIGISATAVPPAGYRLDVWSRSLVGGDDVFDRAVDALRNWRVHRGAGLIVEAVGPPTVGLVVAMAAPLPVGYVEVVCRVVGVVDQPDRCGLTYRTLSAHPEQGEESFTVVRVAGGDISFEIVAASRPRHLLARTFPPVARRLQNDATSRYLNAMQSAVTN
jgi:uncharacterized protein (UPF0548 family)